MIGTLPDIEARGADTPRFILNLHAQQQAHEREIRFEDRDYVLTYYDTRRDAQPLPNRAPAEIFIADIRGNRLRVYVEKGTGEPYEVKTVAWEVR